MQRLHFAVAYVLADIHGKIFVMLAMVNSLLRICTTHNYGNNLYPGTYRFTRIKSKLTEWISKIGLLLYFLAQLVENNRSMYCYLFVGVGVCVGSIPF